MESMKVLEKERNFKNGKEEICTQEYARKPYFEQGANNKGGTSFMKKYILKNINIEESMMDNEYFIIKS